MLLKKLSSTFLLLTLFILVWLIFPHRINATWIKISDKPIVAVGSTNVWDQNRVGSMSVIFDGSIFKMWYEGYSGSNWRIGYATSPDGIVWSKYSTYVVDGIDNGNNFNVHDPKVMFKNNNFKMWYAASNSFINNIHINYTDSLSGISWNTSLTNVMSPTLSWENDISFPYTIFKDNQYKMWYAARGSYNSSTSRWRIGYATSPDGTTWTKNPDPAFWAMEPWEGKDVGNPSVIFDETTHTYEMFYHGDYGIGRATSPDGITWTRDPANPILTSTPETFDSKRVFNPYVLKKDGIYYLWYTGVMQVGPDEIWQIGLATSEPLPALTVTPPPTSTPTPTTTPTLTSTLTPTLTLTPTPNINQSSSPIVIIPGLGASWNPKDIFSCDINSSGNWILAPYVSIYNRLIKTLTQNGGLVLNRDVYLYTYDWRKPLPFQANRFREFLDNIRISRPGDVKFRIIGHSLGGLIARSYLEYYPIENHIISIQTIGTPHLGTVAVYPIWEKGEIQSDDLLFSIGVNQVINHCRIIRTFIPSIKKSIFQYKFKNSRELVQYLVPVVKQLLPTFDYIRQNGQLKPTTSLKHQNDWLAKHPIPPDHYNVSFHSLSGGNNSTLRFLDVVNPTIRESALGDWLDGKPIGNEKINEGDGTVLNLSSQIEGANNENISGNHGEIISSDTGIAKILNFLGLSGVGVAPFAIIPEETSKNALTIALDQDAQIKITDPKGLLLEAKDNIFVSYNPAAGLYRLEITPKQTSSSYLHLSQIEKGQEAKSQTFSLPLSRNRPTRYYLIYNPNNATPLNLIPIQL